MNKPIKPGKQPTTAEYALTQPECDATQPRLLGQVRAQIRLRHCSISTETQNVQWIKRVVLFHHKGHPREMGAAEVEAFLIYRAVQGHVASATQNQALSALLFFYRQVLGVERPWLDDVVRAKRPEHLPVVLSRREVKRVLERMDGVHALLYGTGMRLMAVIRLRVEDVNLAQGELLIRDGKGAKDRVTMLREAVAGDLLEHLRRRRLFFDDDLRLGKAMVYLPDALERYYSGANTTWPWPYVLTAASHSVDSRSGVERPHHLDEKWLQRAMNKAVAGASIDQPATPHMPRRSPPICPRTATTFAPFMRCLATPTSRRR